MDIYVTHGVGSGRTEKSAFDEALWKAGVANYNILELSSVIPEGANIKVQQIDKNAVGEHGYKLYAVLAHQIVKEKGKEAWAGIGWVQDDKTKGGLFVEHHGHSEAEVNKLIEDSLEDMKKYRPQKYGKAFKKAAGIKCEDKPVCALVCAFYKSESWE